MNTFKERLAKLEQSARRATRHLPRLIIVGPGDTKEQAMARLGIDPKAPRDVPDLVLQFIEPGASLEPNDEDSGSIEPADDFSAP